MTKRKAVKHEIIYRAVDSLQADPSNSNTHPIAQLRQLAKSIQAYGFTKPVMLKADGKTIGAGNGAWEAAKLEGLKEIPTITLQLTDEQWRAYAILDNRIPRNAEWNEDVLRAELTALHAMGLDLGDMGFGDMELGNLGVDGFALEARLERAEETPALSKKPIVKLGELWILGEHRVLCGDSTSPDDVARLLQGGVLAKPNLLVSDPPYGVNYDPAWRGTAKRAGTGERLSLGVHAKGKVTNDDNADWRAAWALFPGNVAYVWHAGVHGGSVQASLEFTGFVIRSQIIWVKNNMVIGRGDYHWQHEPCLYAVRDGKPGSYHGGRKQTTVWAINKPQKSETGHGTQKPVECMRRPILNNSAVGDGIYDPFLGSGTTVIACQMEKRVCAGMEIDPAYVEVIIERWEGFTGLIATREDGKTLADLKKTPKKGKK